MRTPYSQFTSLIVVVAALALVGGIAIVLVTSRDSLELAPEIWFGAASPVAQATQPSPSPSPTAVQEQPTEPRPTPVVIAPSDTPEPSPTPEPSLTPTPDNSLPEGVIALARVDLAAAAARLRDAPNGRVIGAVLKGALVQVLQGREEAGGVIWVEIRDDTGQTGWMAEDLLVIQDQASLAPPTAAGPEGSPTALPTLATGTQGRAVVSLSSGTAARLRDAPAGRVIGGLPDGTPLEVLPGREVRDGVVWVEVRDDTGQTGWISEDLIEYVASS